MDKVSEILEFWFNGLADQTPGLKGHSSAKRWFMKNQKFDEEIKSRFEGDIERAQAGQYEDWKGSPRGRLALVILFDQFSRNIYRETPKMFAFDPLALELSLLAIKDGYDRRLQLIERVFLYMPLQHSEDIEVQKRSLECFSSLALESKKTCPHNTPYFEYSLDYARRHHDIIARFNRFPHRNANLGRVSTAQEVEFLSLPGSRF